MNVSDVVITKFNGNVRGEAEWYVLWIVALFCGILVEVVVWNWEKIIRVIYLHEHKVSETISSAWELLNWKILGRLKLQSFQSLSICG